MLIMRPLTELLAFTSLDVEVSFLFLDPEALAWDERRSLWSKRHYAYALFADISHIPDKEDRDY